MDGTSKDQPRSASFSERRFEQAIQPGQGANAPTNPLVNTKERKITQIFANPASGGRAGILASQAPHHPAQTPRRQAPLVVPAAQSEFTRAMNVSDYLGRHANSASTVRIPDWVYDLDQPPTSRSNPVSVAASISPASPVNSVTGPVPGHGRPAAGHHGHPRDQPTQDQIRAPAGPAVKVNSVKINFDNVQGRDCLRCGKLHDYSSDLCTEQLDVIGNRCGDLDEDEYFYRIATKVHCGFMTQAQAAIPQDHLCPRCNENVELGIEHTCSISTIRSVLQAQLPRHHLCYLCDGILEPGVKHLCSNTAMGSVLGQLKQIKAHLSAPVPVIAAPVQAATTIKSKATQFVAAPSAEDLPFEVRRSGRAPQPSVRAKASKEQDTLHKQQKAEAAIAHQLALIDQAQAQLRALQSQQASTTARVKVKVNTGHRLREKLMADLSNDADERQQIRSSKVLREEVRSDDESADERAEMPKTLLHNKLFNFKDRKAEKDSNGYVVSDFVVDDLEGEPEGSDAEADDNDDDDPDYEHDDDAPTPSPTRKVNTKVMQELAELRAFKQAITTQHSFMPLPRAEPLTDHHGRALVSQDINFRTLDPPPHGLWDDLSYLMTTFKDAYDIYRRRSGKGKFDSIWECYNPTAQANLAKRLGVKEVRVGSTVTQVDRNVTYLASLTDDGLLDLLCSEMGIEYASETETELRKLRLQGSPLVKSNWVTLQTAWERVLKRTTERGKILPKELSKIFIQCIEDKYIKKWLTSQEPKTWTAAYDKVLSAITDVHWVIGHSEHTAKEKASDAKTAPFKPNKPVMGAAGDVIQGGGHNVGDPAKSPAEFNPLTFKNKAGKLNVNPNLKKKMGDLNPEKRKCTRCDYVHNFDMSLCTSDKKADNATSCAPLAADELARRHKAKWELGVLYTSIPLMGPTPANAAAATTNSVKALSGGGK